MLVTYNDNFIYFQKLTTEERHILETNFSPYYDKKKGYRVALNLWSLRELWQLFPDLRNSNIESIGKEMKAKFDHLLALRNLPFVPKYHELLRSYQNEDIDYLINLPRAGVFNEPRTGKTPTMITLLKTVKPNRAIVVCPASLIYNWKHEFDKWYPEAAYCVISGDRNKRRTQYEQPYDVFIVSKDTLKLDVGVLTRPFDMIIVDEAHFLRNYKSSQSRAVFKLKGDRRYALTGTPTVKHPSDIFGILHFLYPEKFTSYWQFVERYFEIQTSHLGYAELGEPKPHRVKELQEIVGLLSVQRKRKDVMEWLPDKQHTTFWCHMSTKQQKLYDDMLTYFLATDGDVELDAPSILAQLTRLRQICIDPSLVGFDYDSGKTESLVDFVTDLGRPVVIMSMFSSYLDKLENIFAKTHKVSKITGIISSREKKEVADKFQRGEIDVLLCNIISAGTGFTLDRADTVIFTDKAYNPADNEQAEDRITPTTKDNLHKHEIISFVCKNTIEEKISKLLEQKKSLTDIVNEGGMKAIKKLLFNV
jgi:SNF2 family DNA or RNA helicase